MWMPPSGMVSGPLVCWVSAGAGSSVTKASGLAGAVDDDAGAAVVVVALAVSVVELQPDAARLIAIAAKRKVLEWCIMSVPVRLAAPYQRDQQIPGEIDASNGCCFPAQQAAAPASRAGTPRSEARQPLTAACWNGLSHAIGSEL
ncbi:hypothetical protein OKHIL_31410 [Mycolicibacterium mageritense]